MRAGSNDICGKEILRIVDHFMQSPMGELCRLLVFDSEGCNIMIRKAFCGTLEPLQMQKVRSLPFFGQLEFENLKGLEDWPHLPMKLCKVRGEYVFALAGPAHSTKNAAGQLVSTSKVLYFGRFFSDAAGTLQNSMPLPAFMRRDAMSDRLCSLLSSPLFLVDFEVPRHQQYPNNFKFYLIAGRLMIVDNS